MVTTVAPLSKNDRVANVDDSVTAALEAISKACDCLGKIHFPAR